jgi:hypothetical protein
MNGSEQDTIKMQNERRIDTRLQNFSKHDFEDWLRQGLEKHLLHGIGPEAFPGASANLALYDYPAEGLAATYSRLSPEKQSFFRLAVADLVNSMELSEDNVVLMETLLHLAVLLPANEVLRGLPFWLRAGYLKRLSKTEADELFDQIFMTVARLATPTKESVNCLREMIALPQFTVDWAGMALEALWSCDGDNIDAHFHRLRPYLQELMVDAPHRPRIWARRLLDAIGLYRIVKTFPRLKYSDSKDEQAVLDTWLLDGLLVGGQPLLECWINDDGQLCFRLADQPNSEEILELENSWNDLYEYLRENNLLHEPASQNKEAENKSSAFNFKNWLNLLGGDGKAASKFVSRDIPCHQER